MPVFLGLSNRKKGRESRFIQANLKTPALKEIGKKDYYTSVSFSITKKRRRDSNTRPG